MDNKWTVAGLFLLTASGFLLPFWPLSVAGILLAAGLRFRLLAVGLGLLLDIAWGQPTAQFGFLYFPFVLLALGAIVGRMLADRYLLGKSPKKLY